MRFAVLVVALAVSACTSDTPSSPSGPSDGRFVLAAGQTVVVPGAGIGTSIVVRFEGVFGDSRCPANALCVWVGDATVRIVVQSANVPVSYDLHTLTPKSVQHHDFTIALESLSPYPSGPPIPPEDYRATLRISR